MHSTPRVLCTAHRKTTLILKLIRKITTLGFKNIELFTQNKVNVIKATFKILKQIHAK
ncbi:hypothetical protein JSR02_00265 [Candidatus Vidania fulgoroideae]|uniref:Uncharacterized protein n=1 Tax=Candidatus Vidania fulgoroideorum TaxID=881286 RepID=A0A974X7A3_9PROT|nr:hypothetical protein JSR02_00265 [Candidatus Vidania fulgoroideae]